MSIRPTSRRNGNRAVSSAPYAGRLTTKKLYIGNLPYEAQWQDLKDHCKQV